MMPPGSRLALYMAGAFEERTGKMGLGVLRYSPNPVVAIIDPFHAGEDSRELTGIAREVPIVGTLAEARTLGAEVLVLGIAPPGGLIPAAWWPVLDEAVALGFSLVNGLHERLSPRYPSLANGQWVWDVRIEPEGLAPATGQARALNNRRALFIGTDMSVGKMTAGLETYKSAYERGIDAAFVATGQIGIIVTGAGVPLDAVRLDYAVGAIEREVLRVADSPLVIVEGQGSLIHPGSSANLPLIRGSMPTHLVLCHRPGMSHLPRHPWVTVPDLRRFAGLYEDLAEACGTYVRPKTVALALNGEAREAVEAAKHETGWPATDPVRFGAEPILNALLA
jgi:uncharacterized NAD-dependent epimerase/dehydratase family protein